MVSRLPSRARVASSPMTWRSASATPKRKCGGNVVTVVRQPPVSAAKARRRIPASLKRPAGLHPQTARARPALFELLVGLADRQAARDDKAEEDDGEDGEKHDAEHDGQRPPADDVVFAVHAGPGALGDLGPAVRAGFRRALNRRPDGHPHVRRPGLSPAALLHPLPAILAFPGRVGDLGQAKGTLFHAEALDGVSGPGYRCGAAASPAP